MSQENVEIVRAVHPPPGTDLVDWFADDPGGRRRIEAAAPFFDPEFEFSGGASERALMPGSARGLDELVEVWREWLKPWETYVTHQEEFIDAGQGRVVVLIRDRGRLRDSDSEVEQVGASVWTVRDGKVSRVEFYARRAEALEAAGLSE